MATAAQLYAIERSELTLIRRSVMRALADWVSPLGMAFDVDVRIVAGTAGVNVQQAKDCIDAFISEGLIEEGAYGWVVHLEQLSTVDLTPKLKKERASKYKFEPIDKYLAEGFNEQLNSLYGGRKQPNLDAWAHEMRLLRTDGHDPADIVNMIRRVMNDEFWRKNILSPDKLRKQWDRLDAQLENVRDDLAGVM